MKSIDEIRDLLAIMNLKKIADGSGVHYNAVHRFVKNKTNPTYETIQKIVKYLEDQGMMK